MKFDFRISDTLSFANCCYNGKVLVKCLLIKENKYILSYHKYQILNVKYFIQFLENIKLFELISLMLK